MSTSSSVLGGWLNPKPQPRCKGEGIMPNGTEENPADVRVDPGIDVREDIGKDEAYTINLKSIVEQAVQAAFEGIRQAQTHFNDAHSDARKFITRIQTDSLDLKAKIDNNYLAGIGANQNSQAFAAYTAMVNNGLVQAQAQDQQRIAHDRTWNIDETAAIAQIMISQLAGVNVSKDAIMQLIVAAIADAQRDVAQGSGSQSG